MKDIIITIALIVISFFLMAKTEISFSPFKIQFKDIYQGIGVVLLFLSIVFFQLSGYRKGIVDGYSEALDYVRKELGIKKSDI